jgi:hypothetical protein
LEGKDVKINSTKLLGYVAAISFIATTALSEYKQQLSENGPNYTHVQKNLGLLKAKEISGFQIFAKEHNTSFEGNLLVRDKGRVGLENILAIGETGVYHTNLEFEFNQERREQQIQIASYQKASLLFGTIGASAWLALTLMRRQERKYNSKN